MKRRRLCLLAALGLVAVLVYGTRGWTLPWVARFLNVAELPQASDYVMILGGGSNSRPFVGAALVRAGLARKVLVPTVQLSLEAEQGLVPAEHELIEKVLRARGISEQAIVRLPDSCSTTSEEAQALARFLASTPGATVTVVTTCYHTRRARRIFQGVLAGQGLGVHFVAAPTDGFDETNWWCFEEGFKTYLTEYLKLAFHLVRRG